jgi:hypothetical protein
MLNRLKDNFNVSDTKKIQYQASNQLVIRMLKYSTSLMVVVLVILCSIFLMYYDSYQFFWGTKKPIGLASMVILLLFEGGALGVICYKNIIDFHNSLGNKAIDNNELESDALNDYLKKTMRNYSPDTVQLLKAWKLSKDEKEKNKLMKLITLQIDSEIKTTEEKPLDDRSETAYLNIIGTLLLIMQKKSLSEHQKSLFGNQSAIVETIIDPENGFIGKYGISKTNLDKKFAAANRSLESE